MSSSRSRYRYWLDMLCKDQRFMALASNFCKSTILCLLFDNFLVKFPFKMSYSFCLYCHLEQVHSRYTYKVQTYKAMRYFILSFTGAFKYKSLRWNCQFNMQNYRGTMSNFDIRLITKKKSNEVYYTLIFLTNTF